MVERSLRSNLKLLVDKETYEAMDSLAELQNKNVRQSAMEVILNFFAAEQNGKSKPGFDPDPTTKSEPRPVTTEPEPA
ncbi:hypothetical protein AAC387_Pa07g2853 [Persea americana]